RGGWELATDFKHPDPGLPYNPDFAAMARSAGIEGVRIDRAGDLGDAVRKAIASGRPYLIDAQISADRNPGGAGVWELPGLGQSQPAIGGRYTAILPPGGGWANRRGAAFFSSRPSAGARREKRA